VASNQRENHGICDRELASIKIFEVQYEGRRRNPKGEPVRYWIDPETRTIWKMQFSEPDALSKSGDLARWRMQRRSRSASLVLDLGVDPFQVTLIAGLVEWPETSKARFDRHESDT
jgi:hypothetical protein